MDNDGDYSLTNVWKNKWRVRIEVGLGDRVVDGKSDQPGP